MIRIHEGHKARSRFKTRRAASTLALLSGAALLLSACAVTTDEGSGDSAWVDRTGATGPSDTQHYALVGDDPERPEVRMRGWVPGGKAAEPYKIVFMFDNPANTYETSTYYGIETAAEALGVELELVKHEAFSLEAQTNEIQKLLTRDDVDGVIVGPVAPLAQCEVIGKTLPNAGFPTVVVNYPICGDDGYTEGLVATSSSQSPAAYATWADWALSSLSESGGGKVGLLTGPEAYGQSIDMKAAIERLVEDYPSVDFVQAFAGDYGPELGLAQTETLMSTHPDLKMIISMGDQISIGAITALQSRSMNPGDVKIFQFAGSDATFELLEQGWIEGIFYGEPVEEAAQGLELLVAYLQGEDVPAFNNLAEDPTLPPSGSLVTRENMHAYAPEA